YPYLRKRRIFFKSIRRQLASVVILGALMEGIFGISIMVGGTDRLLQPFLLTIEIVTLFILAYPLFILLSHKQKHEKYTNSVIVAFAIYLLAPIIDMINIAHYSGYNRSLILLSTPLPIISIIVFTRAIYLKLVDKATLRQKLNRAEMKYVHEKEMGKLKDEFLSIISHELKTPLTTIRLYVSLLREGKMGPNTPKQDKALTVMDTEGKRLTNLINDILDLSKLESKKVVLRPRKQGMKEVVEASIHPLLAQQKRIKIINEVPSDEVIMDPDKMKQVFMNLFSNAVKYTQTGGTITLGGRVGRDGWTFWISDNGRGIERSKLVHLFDKFYQVENYLTRESGGTGLGLAIVKHIVELHEGTIAVQSRIGEGSRFTVRIPHSLLSKDKQQNKKKKTEE
ncbi:MAG: HAMP domain-containing sensor histidine kinase, partial [Nanoarchaeota archaeon]